MFKSNWFLPAPIWAARPTSDGFILSFSVPFFVAFLMAALAGLNFIVWGFIGLWVALKVVF